MAATTPATTPPVNKMLDMGSEMERRTRSKQHFQHIESLLPDIKSKTGQASDHRPSLLGELLSCLGPYNPIPQKIGGKDTVWLFDNTAYRSATGQWQAEFVVAVFDQNTGVKIDKVVANIAERLGLGEGEEHKEAKKIIQERLMPFMQSTLPGRLLLAEFAELKALRLGPGGRNAISSDTRLLPKFDSGTIVTTVANVPLSCTGIKEAKTFYAEPEGWGLISDIDDTIKITMTSSPEGILRSTFVSDPTPITGMPEFYKFISGLMTPAAPFFYLSASPYNLYAFLTQFLYKYYLPGTLILRDASWTNLRGLLTNLTLNTREYKVSRMVKINSWLPDRKMICIGDSTQSDPEAYGDIYRKYPNWIKLILIRKVTDIASIGIAEKNEPERFEKAFDGIPTNIWHVFEDPGECYDIVKEVVGEKS